MKKSVLVSLGIMVSTSIYAAPAMFLTNLNQILQPAPINEASANNSANQKPINAAKLTLAVNKASAKSKPAQATSQTNAVAVDQKNEPPKPPMGSWKGTNVSLGGAINTGNSSADNLNGAFNLKYKLDKWTYIGTGTYQYAQDGNQVTNNQTYLQTVVSYSFTPRRFAYTQLDFLDDAFNGYNYIMNLNLGYGRHFDFESDMSLDIYGGPGIRHSVPEQQPTVNLPSFQLGTRYQWNINKTTQFGETLQTTTASDDTYTQSITTLTTNLTDNLAFQVRYQITNDTKPINNSLPTNTTTTLQLVYNFK